MARYFLLAVAWLCIQKCHSQNPAASLSFTNGTSLPNITIINSGDLTFSASGQLSDFIGVQCSVELAVINDNIGTWLDLGGSPLPFSRGDDALFSIRKNGRIELFRQSALLTSLEGIYTCRIPDQSNNLQTLFAGLYTPATLQAQGSLQVMTPLLSVESPNTTVPPTFTVTCTSSVLPPTEVIWTRNDQPLPEGTADSIQELRDARTSTFDNVLRVRNGEAGVYRCLVRNAVDELSREIRIEAPSTAPTGVSVETPGDNVVVVSWTPLDTARQYIVTYVNGSSTTSITVSGPPATLPGFLVDIQYSITVQGVADLSGPISSPVTVTLSAPGPPNNVRVTGSTTTGITISWDSLLGAAELSGFEVSYSPADESCEGIQGGSAVLETSTATSHILQDLEEFTIYNIAVRSRGEDGFGVFSESVQRMTGADLPAPPVMVSAEGSSPPSPSSFSISWQETECREINAESISQYVVRFGLIGTVLSQRTSRISDTTSLTITADSTALLRPLVEYEFQVAAVNDVGQGNFSSPVRAAILANPGPVNALTATPDIVSIVVMWDQPSEEMGRDFITEYEVTHRVPMGNTIESTRVDNSTFSLRVSGLIPDVSFSFSVRALIGSLEGEQLEIIRFTNPIGVVREVEVETLSDTSVRVSWTPLDSQDVEGYQVFYSIVSDSSSSRRRQAGGEASVVFLGSNVSSGVIEGLDQQAEYQFQVAVVITVSGLVREGQRSEMTTIFVEGSGGGLSAPAIAGIVIGVIILAFVVIIFGLIVVLLWRRGRSGRFVLKKKQRHEVEPKSPSMHAVPLPDFEPFVSVTKPVIQQYPSDITTMEGKSVSFHPKVAGSPPPTVAWYHNGTIVSSDYAMELGEDGTLTFVSVELKHDGIYRFTVSNSAGSIQGQVQLTVLCEDDSKNVMTDTDNCIETRPVALSEFGAYVQEMHSNNNSGFWDQFFRLPKGYEGKSIAVSQQPENKNLNRFTNITVYDDNRIKLDPISGSNSFQHDYINACYINGYSTEKKFVATQGPLENTVVDFWRMVWQLRVPTIVMITNLAESGRLKCTQYWPDEDTVDYGPFRVFLSGTAVHGNFTIRTFHVNLTTVKSQSPHKVIQYHFTGWPDHGVPNYASPMLSFHQRIMTEHKSMLGPLLVHCSAGTGRTGTFIALDLALEQARKENVIDLVHIVSNLRKQRTLMVQTKEQYMFVHDAVLESLVCGNTRIQPHNIQHALEHLRRWDPKTSKSGFDSQFQVLDQVSPKVVEVTCDTAKRNTEKNRPNIYLPPDKHRVVLRAEHPDYIHAIFVNGYKKMIKFILTQGPMANTTRDFWKMVFERNSQCVVMLSDTIEEGQEVCYQYWPDEMGKVEQFGEFDVSLLEIVEHDGFVERICNISDSKSGQTHKVTLYRVGGWEPYGAIFNIKVLLDVIDRVTNTQNLNGSGPIVVHCSNIIIRSAIFCCVCNVIECCSTEKVVDIFQAVKALRNQRPGAIPTVEQYQTIHEIVAYYVLNHTQQVVSDV